MSVLACGGLSSVAGALAADDWNACAMLRRAEVEAAFAAHHFDEGSPGRAVATNSPKAASVSTCTYTARGATPKETVTVSLLARRAPGDTSGITPEAARAGAVQLKATPVDVAGLGPGAYWVNLGSSALPSVQLNVFRGKRDWLVIGVTARSLDSQAALEGLRKIAGGLVARP